MEKISLMNKFDVLCKRLDCDSCPCCDLKVCSQSNDELTDADYEEAIKAFEDAGYTADVIDMVNHPAHYEKYSIECIDAMMETQGVEATKQFCICNAFKYLWRHNAKNGDEDIRKASWYLNKAVEIIDKKEEEIREKFCPSPTVENFIKVLNKTKREYIVKTNDEEGGST